MPSFDAVSKVDLMELDNALNVAMKELSTRYDFRGTNTSLERTPEGIVARSSDEPHLEAAVTVLRELPPLEVGFRIEGLVLRVRVELGRADEEGGALAGGVDDAPELHFPRTHGQLRLQAAVD